MKVALPPGARPHHHEPRPVPGGGASFAALIEGGASALAIKGERALGFSETGLLGLHYAVGADRAAPSGPHAVPVTNDAVPESLEPETRIGPEIADSTPRFATGSVPAASVPPAKIAPAARSRSNAEPPGGSVEAGPLMTESFDADPPRPGRAAARPQRAERREIRFRLEVAGPNDAAAVLIEDDARSGVEAEELEALAREVGREFGVTVTSLVARTFSRGNRPN